MFDLQLIAGKDVGQEVCGIAALDRPGPVQIVQRADHVQIFHTELLALGQFEGLQELGHPGAPCFEPG